MWYAIEYILILSVLGAVIGHSLDKAFPYKKESGWYIVQLILATTALVLHIIP